MKATAFVYILANKYNTTLYTGVSTAIRTRVWEHQTHQNPQSFTARYNVDKLVYYEGFDTLTEAIRREKYIKGKSRAWKNNLITSFNPDWKELIPPAD
jgi:putative endonuclease